MEAITVHPKNKEQLNALEVIFKAMKVPFEKKKVNGHAVKKNIKGETYNPDFVEKILESQRQVKEGKVTRVKKERLKEFLGL